MAVTPFNQFLNDIIENLDRMVVYFLYIAPYGRNLRTRPYHIVWYAYIPDQLLTWNESAQSRTLSDSQLGGTVPRAPPGKTGLS